MRMKRVKNRRDFLWLAAATPITLLQGCAKVPSGTADEETRYVEVTIRVVGRIRQTSEEGIPYSYFFLVNFVDDISADSGPAPVVQPPWNNGFVAPGLSLVNSQGFTGFVVFGGSASQGYYKALTSRIWILWNGR
jgi:hypothetical protein